MLIGLLVMAVFGVHWGAVFDPLVWLYRTTTVAIIPSAWWSVEDPWIAADKAEAAAREDPSNAADTASAKPRPTTLKPVLDPGYRVFRDNVYLEPHPGVFLGGGLILLLFVGMVGLNAVRRRFWCRYLCPLGALLGVFAWRPLLRRATQRESCSECGLCGMACPGAAAGGGTRGQGLGARGEGSGLRVQGSGRKGVREQGLGAKDQERGVTQPRDSSSLAPSPQPLAPSPAPAESWRPSECLGCLNCTDSCPRESLGFQWVSPLRREPAAAGIDLSRRAVVGAALGGLIALPILRISAQSRGRTFNPDLIRPPGAGPEREFLARCTGCGMCIKVCPTGGLQPTLAEAGLEGIWTPRLVPQLGFCDYSCNLCGQVCPTQAIQRLPLDRKQQVRIGVAVIDVTRCIPYAYGRDCITCEEQCPSQPEKAIFAVEVSVVDASGQKKSVKQPHVDPERCIGCGRCESVCPYHDRPAIRISSANESRHPGNQPFQGAQSGI